MDLKIRGQGGPALLVSVEYAVYPADHALHTWHLNQSAKSRTRDVASTARDVALQMYTLCEGKKKQNLQMIDALHQRERAAAVQVLDAVCGRSVTIDSQNSDFMHLRKLRN